VAAEFFAAPRKSPRGFNMRGCKTLISNRRQLNALVPRLLIVASEHSFIPAARRMTAMSGHMTLAEPETTTVGIETNLSQPTTVDLIRLIRGEYLEIPNLHLTKPQVRRLWHLDAVVCDELLDILVSGRFLRRTEAGAYVRADRGEH
jgi:hypothetical protein